MFLTSVRPAPELIGEGLPGVPEHMRRLGVLIAALPGGALRLPTPVTVVVGDNGAGKSTLLEAIAVGLGVNPEGGSRHARFATGDEDYPEWLICSRAHNPRDVYFLRGETFLNLSEYHHQIHSPENPDPLSDLPFLSHGQGLLALVERRFHSDGMIILDEPEDGLSYPRQVEVVTQLERLAAQGAQVILATHSPVFLSMQGATVYAFGDKGIAPVAPEATEAVHAAREFLADPLGTAAFLIGEGE
ncbi:MULTISPECIES: AAA family ATPase [Corynebacterium]|uniref:ABC transport system, ATP-binding protein n=6 Tax=Corynebacterium TaxID=1716 RepID=C3PJB6_CORA7|nr:MULTISPECIES: AAA family ATPase [Corynebacterium]OFN75048.1 ATPase [Corynebacterium sp. HMSC074E01]OFP66178.1 ATPase [Corynebacterium sp. HMSC074C01]ACP33802.1 ABC transport system, ATP-binding protein [Corynebacterium aurimucosum ATCC 700975]MBE7339461.1 AAA family ATPase [Corynebacterium aurimucosum]MBU5654730.1 AAA family ATPase [Corynebacterium aurimucosum]